MITSIVLNVGREISDVSISDTLIEAKIGATTIKDVTGLVVSLIFLLEHLRCQLSNPLG